MLAARWRCGGGEVEVKVEEVAVAVARHLLLVLAEHRDGDLSCNLRRRLLYHDSELVELAARAL
jgi:hypothetical protein